MSVHFRKSRIVAVTQRDRQGFRRTVLVRCDARFRNRPLHGSLSQEDDGWCKTALPHAATGAACAGEAPGEGLAFVAHGTGMRLAEASALSMSDLCADQMGTQFFMRTSKADEFRNGTEGHIGRQPSHKLCLMRIIEAHILRSGLAGRTSNVEMVTPIPRGLRFQKRTGASTAEAARMRIDKNGDIRFTSHVSLGQMRKDFRNLQAPVTPASPGHTCHASGRSAFATALHEGGVDPESIKIAARWATAHQRLRHVDVDRKKAAHMSDVACSQLHSA